VVYNYKDQAIYCLRKGQTIAERKADKELSLIKPELADDVSWVKKLFVMKFNVFENKSIELPMI
jgi:hypothetical protein